MGEVTLIRLFIIIYVGCSLFAAGILWLNAGADDAGHNAVIAVASVLAVLAAVTAYLVPKPLKDRVQIALFYDAKAKHFTLGDDGGAYFGAFLASLGGVKTSAESLEEAFPTTGANLLEKAIVTDLSFRFANAWDIEVASLSPPGGGHMQATYAAGGAGREFGVQELARVFAHNPYAASIAHWPLTLPPESEMTAAVVGKKRVITITNPYFVLAITIGPNSAYALPDGVAGVISAPANEAHHYALIYNIELLFEPSKWRGHSPLMPAYRRWFENVQQTLRAFDWSHIKAEIDAEALRDAASAVLNGR